MIGYFIVFTVLRNGLIQEKRQIIYRQDMRSQQNSLTTRQCLQNSFLMIHTIRLIHGSWLFEMMKMYYNDFTSIMLAIT